MIGLDFHGNEYLKDGIMFVDLKGIEKDDTFTDSLLWWDQYCCFGWLELYMKNDNWVCMKYDQEGNLMFIDQLYK